MTDIFVTEFGRDQRPISAQTFTEMFGGGKASLELEDRPQPLTCGIEIRVQPPGKQLKTITLLSGGEKAFVAIALYFAILKVRPTPFCMLDEIDAALDDRNVERFAGYLRGFSEKTQFIVITHRRGTMEAADVLYGVTMQEQGVSTHPASGPESNGAAARNFGGDQVHMGFFEKIKNGLTKTRAAMANTLGGIFASFSGANEDFYEELEESMILADIGVETSVQGRRAAPHRREGAQASAQRKKFTMP